jgi:hypothetical protein
VPYRCLLRFLCCSPLSHPSRHAPFACACAFCFCLPYRIILGFTLLYVLISHKSALTRATILIRFRNYGHSAASRPRPLRRFLHPHVSVFALASPFSAPQSSIAFWLRFASPFPQLFVLRFLLLQCVSRSFIHPFASPRACSSLLRFIALFRLILRLFRLLPADLSPSSLPLSHFLSVSLS